MPEKKWELNRGWADWGMPCEHSIFQGEIEIARIPSVTPYCMGASAKDKDYAAQQWKNAQLLVAAPEMAEMLLYCVNYGHYGLSEKTRDIAETLLKKAGVL